MRLAGPPSVWVVDDSPLDAERARRVLASSYAVQVFNDGSASLERLSAGDIPDVIVLDWVMPGVSGLEVCRFLRAQPAGMQGMGVLLLTAHRDTAQIVEGLSAGANDYLAKPYADEELSARVGSLVRSTQLLRRAEEAEALNRRLLETGPDPLFVIDEEGALTFANEQATHVLGHNATALLGQQLSHLIPGLELGRPSERPFDSVLPMPDLEIRGRRFSPTVRALAATPTPSTIVALRDVTERRILDERRLDFYAIIAHDLRTPLHVINLRVAGMLERSPVLIRSDAEKIQNSVHTLSAMINDFLQLASLEVAAYRLERAEVDLHTLIEAKLEALRPLLESRSQMYFGPSAREAGDAVVVGDAARLGQAVSNLLGNAIKFTPPGGSISVNVLSGAAHVEVTFQDTGCGIAPDVITTLFQRYRRAAHDLGGTGLGLLIVREIVEAHGGSVGVESILGQGSRFWLRLPTRPQSRASA